MAVFHDVQVCIVDSTYPSQNNLHSASEPDVYCRQGKHQKHHIYPQGEVVLISNCHDLTLTKCGAGNPNQCISLSLP